MKNKQHLSMRDLIKRVLFIVLIIGLSINFVGCKPDKNIVPPHYDKVDGPDDNPNDEPTDEPEEEPVVLPKFDEFYLSSQINEEYITERAECVIAEDGSISYDGSIKTLKPVYEGITLTPSFKVQEGITVYVGDVEQKDGRSPQDLSQTVTYRLVDAEGNEAEYPVSLNFDYTGLPIVVIQTENGAPIVSKDDWLKATMLIEGGAEFDDLKKADISIAGRGNSTWGYDKKPYKIKLDSKAKVLGMPKHKRWVLLANYIDKTMLRNDVSFYLGKQTSLPWTPRGYHVEVIINDVHLGNYYLCEQIKIDENRVNIAEMDPGSDDVTGGYLMEMDTYHPDDDETLFHSKYEFRTEVGTSRIPFKIKDPEAEDLTDNQLNYIKGYIHDFEDALFSDDWLDEEKGYKRYIDLDSFIDIYLVSELIYHTEWQHPKSSYMHKDSNGKLVSGPMWDYDWTTFSTRTGWYCRECLWYPRMFEDPAFVAELKEHWTLLYPKFRGAIDYMTKMKSKLAASAEKNYAIWGEGMYGSPNGEGAMTFEQSVDKIIDRYTERIEWLNTEFNKL